jgi:lipid II:glycine glycyltransferase (peptidoglycan interpeptide bridge formation enzyme)
MVSNLNGQPLPEPAHDWVDQRIGQLSDLPEGGRDAVLAAVSSEARANVSKARRRGVSAEIDNDAFDVLQHIHAANMEAIGGVPKASEFFAALRGRLRAGSDYDLWVARRAGLVTAALLVLRFNGVAEYFCSGTYLDEKVHNPHAALLAAALGHESELGTRTWNWGGTWLSQHSVYRFKRKWGAREARYRYFTTVNDRELLATTPERLLERFPRFYVAPFGALTGRRRIPLAS